MEQSKVNAIDKINALEDGDLEQKVEALAYVINPVTEGLSQMDGKTYVNTMSVEAIEMYSEAFAYFAKNGNFSAYNS